MEDTEIRLTKIECELISRYLYSKLLYFDEQLKRDIYALLIKKYCKLD